MDRERFQALCREALAGERRREGIGTLGEKTLHAVLKAYFAGPGDRLEVPVGPFVADVQGPEGVVEIQTGNFRRLREKLPLFLSLGPVTVVYPVAAKKGLVWLEEDGALTPRRKSPKAAGPWQVLPELYDIRDLLLAPVVPDALSLGVFIVMLAMPTGSMAAAIASTYGRPGELLSQGTIVSTVASFAIVPVLMLLM